MKPDKVELENKMKQQFKFYGFTPYFMIVAGYIIVFQTIHSDQITLPSSSLPAHLFLIYSIVLCIASIVIYRIFLVSGKLTSRLPDAFVNMEDLKNLDFVDRLYLINLNKLIMGYLFFVILLINISAMFGVITGVSNQSISKTNPFMLMVLIAAVIVKPDTDRLVNIAKGNR